MNTTLFKSFFELLSTLLVCLVDDLPIFFSLHYCIFFSQGRVALLSSMQQSPRSCGFKTYGVTIFLILSFLIYTSRHLFEYQHNSSLPPFAIPNNNLEHEYYLDKSGPSEQTAPSVNFINLEKLDLPFAPYNPYPDYNTREWKKQWRGAHKACMGPRGVNVNGNTDDMLVATSVEPVCKCYDALTTSIY